MAKILVNRITRVLLKWLTYQRQSVFLERFLLHCILVANEAIDEARRKNEKNVLFSM